MAQPSIPVLPEWMRLRRLGACDSTNEIARVSALAGEAECLVVVATEQTAGRGRRGRVWHSGPGNLYSSFLFRPKVPAMEAARLSFACALAVAEAVESLLPAPAPQIVCKWPNDVLVGGAKISGILLESSTDGTDGIGFVIAGIGINVAHYPEGLEYPATSLHEQGSHATVNDALSALAARLGHWYVIWQREGFAPVRAAWLARADMLGQRIRARVGNEELWGVFETLDQDGTLVLLTDDGSRRRISAGEVFRA